MHNWAPKQPVGQFISIPKITVSLYILYILHCHFTIVQFA